MDLLYKELISFDTNLKCPYFLMDNCKTTGCTMYINITKTDLKKYINEKLEVKNIEKVDTVVSQIFNKLSITGNNITGCLIRLESIINEILSFKEINEIFDDSDE